MVVLFAGQQAFLDLVDANCISVETSALPDAALTLLGQRAARQIDNPQPAPLENAFTSEAALAMEDAPQTTDALITYIQQFFHGSHRNDLTELMRLATQMQSQCHDDGHVAHRLVAVLSAIDALLTAQMQQDNSVLFPMMRSASCPKMTHLIRRSLSEHGRLRDLVADALCLLEGSAPLAAADRTWAALQFGTRDFADDLLAHLHLKETVLFARFL